MPHARHPARLIRQLQVFKPSGAAPAATEPSNPDLPCSRLVVVGRSANVASPGGTDNGGSSHGSAASR
eukprot:6706224-Alexandrium_andersonii.AAC.1